MKVCSTCSQGKSPEAFNRDKSKRDGLCSVCRECSRQRSASWRGENPERNAAIKREWYERNAPQVAERFRARYAVDRDAILARRKAAYRDNVEQHRERDMLRGLDPEYRRRAVERVRAWREANREHARAQSRMQAARRNARKRSLPNYAIAARDVRRLLSSPCAVPGCTRTDIQLDHIIPIARGGSHGAGNLQSLCAAHNQAKGARLWIEFRVYLARQHQLAA